MKRKFLYTTILFAFLNVQAKEIPLQFFHITTEQGLSNSTVTCFLQDRMGFLWIGTADGLNLYDGYSFKVFQSLPGDTNTISGSYIKEIKEDREGNIWVAAKGGGLNKYDRRIDKWYHYIHNESDVCISDNQLLSLCIDSAGIIWCGTKSSGIDKYDPVSKTFKNFRLPVKEPAGSYQPELFGVLEYDAERLLISSNEGLYVFNKIRNEFLYYSVKDYDSSKVFNKHVLAMCINRNREVWLGVYGTLIIRFDPDSGKLTSFDFDKTSPYTAVRTIIEDSKGNHWLGIEGKQGLVKIDSSLSRIEFNERNLSDPNSLNTNIIDKLFIDNSGIMWLASLGSGLDKLDLNDKKFSTFRLKDEDEVFEKRRDIWQVYQDKERLIWLGTNTGLKLFDPVNKTYKTYRHENNNPFSISNNNISCIAELSNGNLLLSTYGGGLNRFDKKSGKFYRIPLSSNNSMQPQAELTRFVRVLRNGNIWVGTGEPGITVLDSEFNVIKTYQNSPDDSASLSYNDITFVYEDLPGNIWVGTWYNGLNRYNPGKDNFKRYSCDFTKKGSISSDVIVAANEDSEGNLWFGTANGLDRYDRNNDEFMSYSGEVKFANKIINGIVPDTQGNLWLATWGGISKLSIKKKTIWNYGVKDGLQGTEIHGVITAADGQLFFAGTQGLNYFYPDKIDTKPNNFPVVITSFKKYYKDYSLGSDISLITDIELPYSEDVFSIGFSLLDYTRPESYRYMYKMEGFDKEWVDSKENRTASYTHLNPGRYIFQVKAANTDGVWSEVKHLYFRIKPPFWMTWWFITISVFLVIGSSVFGYRVRLNKMRFEKERELSELRSRFVTMASHEFRTPLTSILTSAEILEKFSHNLSEEKRLNNLKRIQSNVLNMTKMLNDILIIGKSEAGKIELKKVKINLQHFCNELVEELMITIFSDNKHKLKYIHSEIDTVIEIDPGLIRQILENLLMNSVKYSPGNNETVFEVDMQGNEIIFRISDKGIGIPDEDIKNLFEPFFRAKNTGEIAGTGLGLAIVKRAAELHGGSIDVRSKLNAGTTFTVRIHV